MALGGTVLMLTDAGNGQIGDVKIIAAGTMSSRLKSPATERCTRWRSCWTRRMKLLVLGATLAEEKATDAKLTYVSTLVDPMAPAVL